LSSGTGALWRSLYLSWPAPPLQDLPGNLSVLHGVEDPSLSRFFAGVSRGHALPVAPGLRAGFDQFGSLELDLPAPQVFDAQHGIGNEFRQELFTLEMVTEIETALAGPSFFDFDKRRVIERIEQHLPVFFGAPALDEVFPYPLGAVQAFADHEKLVPVHEILVDEGIDAQEVVELLPDFKHIVRARTRFCIEILPLARVLDSLEIVGELPLFGHLLDMVKEPHAQCIRVDPHPW